MSACKQCGFPTGVDDTGLCLNCRQLKAKPDATSKRKELHGVPFDDMKQVEEEQRFVKIAEHLKQNPGKVIAVMVDCGPGYEDKGDRYIRGVRKLVPGVKVVGRQPWVINGELIKFRNES